MLFCLYSFVLFEQFNHFLITFFFRPLPWRTSELIYSIRISTGLK